jgi:hypothetical protein
MTAIKTNGVRQMAYDGKYGRVTTEFGDIGEGEPVIVFRAQDGTLPNLLAHYLMLCSKAGSPRKHLDIILDTIERVQAWQDDPANYVRRAPSSEGPAGQSYDERHPRSTN